MATQAFQLAQVEASTNQLADQQMPVYNLASKILCQVINVSLKAEPDTDEVFAQVTLLPESNVSGFLWLELQSTSFVADQKLPYLDFAGISTQLLQTLFKVKGVVHYGIAGNSDPQLEIGDVTIPQFWAHSGLWNWQEVESNLSRFWNVLESKKLTQAVISKLEEALWINNRKYDALWCWEMLKLLAHFALRTRMRQRFQKVLQCFLKAFNEKPAEVKFLRLGSAPWVAALEIKLSKFGVSTLLIPSGRC